MSDIQQKIKRCSETQRGRIVIHKGDTEKRICPDQLQQYLEDNWEKGPSDNHRKSNSSTHSGRQPWNKNTHGLVHKNKSTWKPGHTPWNKGKKSAQKAWNKGLTKETDPRVAKTSNSKTGHEVSQQVRDAVSKASKGKHFPKEQLEIILSKKYLTHRKNNSFNTSKAEQELYGELLKTNKTVLRQYKDPRYPFYCDFYIKEDDLFIELNAHWSHGGHPFNPEDDSDQKMLAEWKEKSKTSQFYKNAIYTWTVRDVKKAEIAKKNHLNYKAIY